MRTDFTRPSCVWHQELPKEMRETLRLTSWGTNPGQGKYAVGAGALRFRHSFCELRINATLPAGAKDKYTAYLSFFGGPYVSDWEYDEWSGMSRSRRESTTYGCNILADSPKRSCSFVYKPPVGYATDLRFFNNSFSVDFFTTDKIRISQIRKTRELSVNYRMAVEIELRWIKCPPAQPATPAISQIVDDQVIFGPTNFALEGNPLDSWKYYLVAFRTYYVKQVSGFDYQVDILSKKSLDVPSRAVTPLTVFVGHVSNDFYYDIDCNPSREAYMCVPPTNMRLRNSTVCTGTSCQGSVRGLDPKKSYVLWVSYPSYIDPGNYGLNYRTSKMTSQYSTELVRTKIWAQSWELGPVKPPK